MKNKNKEKTTEGLTHEEKIEHLDAEIAKAKEEGNEYYLEYLLRIRKMTINVHQGGTVIFQSGTLPKY